MKAPWLSPDKICKPCGVLINIETQVALSFYDFQFINKGERNWLGSYINKCWAPRINFEEHSTSQISISFHLISQAFKRELKTKEPVIMSTLETVRIFLTEQPLEGLEKLYQEPRGNWMWNCNNILIEGSVMRAQPIHACCQSLYSSHTSGLNRINSN